MKLFLSFSLRQLLKVLRKTKANQVFGVSWMAIGFGFILTTHTFADERKTPLQIQIPSVPTRHSSVNVVDDSLSVQLLDAQMKAAQQAQPPPVSAASTSPPVASGQMMIGSPPAKPTSTRRVQKKTSKPAVVMAGSGVVAPNQTLSLGAPPSYLSAPQPRRVTAVMPEPSASALPPMMQPTANPAQMPMEAAMQASAQLLAQAAMQASAQMLTQAAAQASAQMLSQAGVQPQVQQQQAQFQAQQQQQAALQAQAEAQRQAELQAQLQAEADARAEAEAQAKLQAQQQAAVEAQRQAQLKAQQQAQIAAQAAADAQAAAEAQRQAQAQAQLQAQAAAEAQARAEAEAQMAANAQAQAQAAAEAAALSQSRLQAQVPAAQQVMPINQAAAQLQAPPSQAPSMVEQFVARLPTLAEAKQSFASEEIVADNNAQDAPYLSNEEASTLAAIEPAAGGGNATIDRARLPQPPEAQILETPQNIAELPVLASDSASTKALNVAGEEISHPAVKQAVEEVLSEESSRLLKRIPSRMDSPKNNDKQRVDIERQALTSSVFSELKSSQDLAEDADAVGMTIDVKRPSLDVSYELDRAYNAIASGQTDIARESYSRVLASEPKNIQALFGMGALLHRAGDLNGARSYYAKVLEQDPDNRDTLNNFLSLVAEEAPEQALSKLKDLESKNPDFSPIPAQISFIYQKTKNMQLAAQYMVKALSLAPNNMTYKYNLAILLDRQGARQDAASFYQELVDAHLRGESIPGNIASIQERLTFIRSNR